MDRYRTVAARAKATPFEKQANDKLNGVIERHQTALRKAIDEFEQRMDEKLRQHRPDEAYDVWKQFPANLRTLQSDQQIEQILERNLPPDFVPVAN